MGRFEAKSLLGRFMHIWDDKTKMYLQEAARGGMGWINLAHNRTNGGVLGMW